MNKVALGQVSLRTSASQPAQYHNIGSQLWLNVRIFNVLHKPPIKDYMALMLRCLAKETCLLRRKVSNVRRWVAPCEQV